jgi:NAD-dependent dihydropyrimidine dehydrogenase PreA subunit
LKLIFFGKPSIVTWVQPAISKNICENCKECVEMCPYDVFEDDGDEVRVAHPEECIECLACVDSCRSRAISMGD